VKFGVWIPSYCYPSMDYGRAQREVGDFARKANDHGIDLWVIDHLLHAHGLYGMTWMEPMSVLTWAGAVAPDVKLGTGILVLPLRNPVLLAKEIATLDYLSGGRFLFGIGGGWNAEEMEDHGVAFKTRWRVLRERVLAMKEIWTRDEAAFQGEHVRFDAMWSFPKPSQRPHPPILMGGDGPTTFDRVLEYCDGWMPVAGRMGAGLIDKIAVLQRRAREIGRAPIPVTAFMVKPDRAALDPLQAAGVTRATFGVPSETAEKVLPLLDSYAKLIR
jgi:probable F420-dependent oxidoreductase